MVHLKPSAFYARQYSVLRGGSSVEACLILHTSLQAGSSRLLPYKAYLPACVSQ